MGMRMNSRLLLRLKLTPAGKYVHGNGFTEYAEVIMCLQQKTWRNLFALLFSGSPHVVTDFVSISVKAVAVLFHLLMFLRSHMKKFSP
mmetsp:Transcript_20855/g.27039  ORF Transcript_20855/g.27039 Transcript_20855/m.27039 type:complete len:88 (-) Transcript_20855:109-372(-)